MDKIEIRPAIDREKEMAANLLSDSEPWITLRISPDQCRKNCYDTEYQLYIAYSENKPSGIILIDPRGVAGSPYIKSIAVWPDFRGSGIGSALLSFAEDLFRNKARFIFICVSSFNHRARNLYEKYGFQAVGEFKDYIIEGASEILMQKRL
jgi:ribosomal protein S18 acetylase RimI-like enzyme